METNQEVRVNEIIRNHSIDGCVYTAYSLDNQAMLYIKEITDADILANVSDEERQAVEFLFKHYKSNQDKLNAHLEVIYKDILMKLSNDYIIYVDELGNTSKYKAQFKRNCYVNIQHPITKKQMNINKLIAHLKGGFLVSVNEGMDYVGDHIDQNKCNNSFDNIRLITPSDNAKNKGNKYVFIRVFEGLM